MFFYLIGMSCVLTYFIFQSVGIDYRLVAFGSLLPIAIDIFFGRPHLGHSFIFPVVLLIVIMLGTINKPRILRRRLLCIPIGTFWALILQGTFMFNYLWFWPLTNENSQYVMSLFPSTGFWVIRDLLGLIAIYILFSVGELYKKEKFEAFLSTGRIKASA